jgi:hypothetical protein
MELENMKSHRSVLPAIGGPMIPAMPRPIDKRPKALVNLPRPSNSHRMMEVSEINAAEIKQSIVQRCKHINNMNGAYLARNQSIWTGSHVKRRQFRAPDFVHVYEELWKNKKG